MKFRLALIRNIIFFFYILFPVISFCQENLKSATDILDSCHAEKVFLHIDRNIYSPGDDIWFKAYLIDDLTLHRSESTSNLHVDLVSSDGRVVANHTIYLDKGIGHGDFHLSDSIAEGFYTICAYTNYIRNFGESFFYKQPIIISKQLNLEASKDSTKNSKNLSIDLQFMPEGGYLINNVNSLVAYKAVDSEGNITFIRASVYNSKDELLQEFSSFHYGMGYFYLTPNPDENYYVRITNPASDKKYFLPKALNEGFRLSVNYLKKSNINIQISANPQKFNPSSLKLIIRARGALVYSKQIEVHKPNLNLFFSKENLPSGLSTITLMDSDNNPIAERHVYNNKEFSYDIDIKTAKKSYGFREKVTLNIQTKDKKGNPIPANLSLSVIDTVGWHGDKSNIPDIQSYFLLSSNFHGQIENPSYYFYNQDNNKLFQLDLVLLTHGWIRYVWNHPKEKINHNLEFSHEKGFAISGYVKTLWRSKPIVGARVTLLGLENSLLFMETNTDSIGYFKFNNLFILDTSRFVIQAFNQNEKRNTIIEMEENVYSPQAIVPQNSSVYSFDNKFAIVNYNRVAQERKFIEGLSFNKNNVLLEQIVVKGKKPFSDDRSLSNYGRAEKVIDFSKMEYAPSDTRSALGSLGFLTIKPLFGMDGQEPQLQLIYRGSRATPKLIVDGIEHSDFGDIELYPVSEIDRIEIVEGSQARFLNNRIQPNAVIIAIFTKAGLGGAKRKVVDDRILYGVKHIRPQGFYIAREFYSPNYEKNIDKFDYSDYRTTIYWQSNITTDSLGRAEVSFFTADINTQYDIILQGISDEDKLGFQKSSINVVDRRKDKAGDLIRR